jgi:hypothetical protein
MTNTVPQEDGANEKWARACLRVYGGDRQAIVEAQKLLGPPSNSPNKQLEKRQRDGLWLRESGLECNAPLSDHIIALINFVASREAAIATLASRYSVDLFCGVGSTSGQAGVVVSPAAMKILGNAGVQMVIDAHIS